MVRNGKEIPEEFDLDFSNIDSLSSTLANDVIVLLVLLPQQNFELKHGFLPLFLFP
jgi:hypothetical protein